MNQLTESKLNEILYKIVETIEQKIKAFSYI